MAARDDNRIMQEFTVRRSRQVRAIGAALFLVLFLALVHKRPAVVGEFSKTTIFGAQAIVISTFIGFTSINWRCPACGKFLGSNINRWACGKCKRRLR